MISIIDDDSAALKDHLRPGNITPPIPIFLKKKKEKKLQFPN